MRSKLTVSRGGDAWGANQPRRHFRAADRMRFDRGYYLHVYFGFRLVMFNSVDILLPKPLKFKGLA